MAVTLIASDLVQPDGELAKTLFAGDEFDSLVIGWLQQAAERVVANTSIVAANHNAAAAAWVYYRAYSYKASLQANTPNQVNFTNQPGISKTMSADQREYFVNLANRWRTMFDGYIVVPTADTLFTGSVMVDTRARW